MSNAPAKNALKRIATLLFVASLIVSLYITTGLSMAAATNDGYVLTGNQRDDIVAVALSQVGRTNADHRYRADNAAWCASFVVWSARSAGIDESIIKTTGYATADDLGVQYVGRSADRTVGINYTPQRGDLIFFDWASNGFCYKAPASFYGDHVGIVTGVSSEGYVHTLEGNSNGMVRERSYLLSDVNIKGYGIPNYRTSAGTSTAGQPICFRMKSGAKTPAFSDCNGTVPCGSVYRNDVVTVTEVYSNGVARLICPWDDGSDHVIFCSISSLRFKAEKYINCYDSAGNKVGRAYPGDICRVVSIDPQRGVVECFVPWDTGADKLVCIFASEIF